MDTVSGLVSQSPATPRDPAVLVRSRKRTAMAAVAALAMLSLLIVSTGLGAATRTDNVAVGGYYPGLVMGFGSFLAIIGINLNANKRPMLVAAIIFISFGVAAAFSCAVVDGVFAARHIDPSPVLAGRCLYFPGDGKYSYEDYNTEVQCPGAAGFCGLMVASRTCYCCELYSCGRPSGIGAYHVFTGVSDCREVVHLYRLLWTTTSLNVLGLMLGIVTAAILGDFKETLRSPTQAFAQPSFQPSGTNGQQPQQVITYTSYCTYPALALSGSSGGYPAASAPPVGLDDHHHQQQQHPQQQQQQQPPPVDLQNIAPSLLPNTPPLYTPMYFPASEKPPAYIP
uniref:Transmembrane protein 255B-like isoform X2 n=1 Tax=Petromyzon marinus TaxID=7757 RepID=A0AAJ7WK55_PETMA|nr:transmembrane protein 255B-like isoform X2 [Petromyzon marinus]